MSKKVVSKTDTAVVMPDRQEISENADVLREQLHEIALEGKILDESLAARESALAGVIANDTKMVKELTELAAIASLAKDFGFDLLVDPAQMSGFLTKIDADTQAELAKVQNERKTEPKIRFWNALKEREASEKAAAKAAAIEARKQAEITLEANAKAFVKSSLEDGTKATILLRAKELKEKAVLAAHKGMEKGKKAPANKVHDKWVDLIYGLIGEYCQTWVVVGNVTINSHVLMSYAREIGLIVDPPRETNNAEAVSANVKAAEPRRGKPSKKARKYAQNEEEKEIGGDMSDIAAFFMEKDAGGDTIGDFAEQQ